MEIGAKPLWIPLFLGLRSTQSPIKAPSRRTEPATTNPNTAVSSRLRPYNSIRNTEMAKCHIRSPYQTQACCQHYSCFAWYCTSALQTPLFYRKSIFLVESDGLESHSYPHGQSSTDIDEKLGPLEVDKSRTLWGDARKSNGDVDATSFIRC